MNNQGKFHTIYILEHAPLTWQGPSGLLNPTMLEEMLERIPDWGSEHTQYLMCGPEGMMHNVEHYLKDRGISGDNLFKESFVAPTIDKPEPQHRDDYQLRTMEFTVIYD